MDQSQIARMDFANIWSYLRFYNWCYFTFIGKNRFIKK